MKKQQQLFVALIIGASTFIYGCKKNTDVNYGQSKDTLNDVSVVGDKLAFSLVNAHENFLIDKNNDFENTKVAGLKFNHSKDTLIEDVFLASVLNLDNMVQIGNKLYMLDFADELCYVSKDITQSGIQKLKAKNSTDSSISVYDFDTEVLYLEDESEKGTNLKWWQRRKEQGASKRKLTNKLPNGKYPTFIGVYKNPETGEEATNFCLKVEAKRAYQRAAIFFGLVQKCQYFFKKNKGSKVECGQVGYIEAPTTINMTSTYKFKPCCKNEEQGYLSDFEDITPGDFKFSWRLYNSTRKLTKYQLDTEFTYIASGSYYMKVIQTVSLLRIQWGY